MLGVGLLLAALELQLADGTRVPVKLMDFVFSETSQAGQQVRFGVTEDVAVDGDVAIKRGTAAKGTVVEATPVRLDGWLVWHRFKPGQLVLSITDTRSVDGQPIRLRMSQAKGGAEVIAVGLMPRALMPRAHEGTRFEAFVEGDYVVK